MAEKKTGEPTAQSIDLEIVRVFDAPRDLVFEMWAKPEHMDRWSAPKGFTIPEARMDFREGGEWYCHMREPNGGDHKAFGRYIEIKKPSRIVMTHDWMHGGEAGPETVVSVDFVDQGGKTKMVFRQTGFASVKARDGHAEGWGECFDLLEEHLATLRKA